MPVMRPKGGNPLIGRKVKHKQCIPLCMAGLNQMTMLKFFYTILGAMLSLCSYGQFSLSGEIRDSESNKLLPGATIRLEPSKLFTISDQFGQFRFEKLPAGEYMVSVSYIGFEQDGVTQITVMENSDVTIKLKPAAIMTDAVVVTATRPTEKTPTTFTTVSRESIQQQNFGQDIPFLINWTPSVVTTSDAGSGIGYTGIRIRGSDATRVNVTINGIPYNDSESLGTFWVDIPDIASSSQSIQIQRGVGTSTNGAGAFGASINLQTTIRNDKAYAEVINSAGSFRSRRHTLNFGSGLLNDHWIVEGRVSKIASDGFIDRASSDLSSYYFSAGFFAKNTMLKGIAFGGKERTYQAWYGVPQSKLENDTEAMEITAINEGWNETQRENLFNSNRRTFNPYTYKNQVDDYQQDHYQLHFSQKISENLNVNAALHYTPGKGYYEEYKYDASFADYGLADFIVDDDGDPSDNDTISTTDLIRRRWLDNDFYGLTYSVNYDKSKWNFVWGGGWNRYDGDHFGEIAWAAISPVPTEHRYYFNNGDKKDFNTFFKTNYQASNLLNLFVDLQYRRIDYTARGIENDLSDISIDASFNFFNPKFGLTYTLTESQQLYGSYAVANREPVREDFLSSTEGAPEHETLQNVEIGYRNSGKNYLFHVNYYLMLYKNQLVLTGELNDVGAPVRTNAGESYRTGIELATALKISRKFEWNANVTISRNKIEKFVEALEDYGENFDQFSIVQNVHENTDISFSPKLIAGSQFSFRPSRDAEIALLTKYVGEQFLDNTGNKNRIIDPYLLNDVRLSYSWKPGFVKEIAFSFLINNILDEQYESNGYTWGYLAGSAVYRENYYYPQAGRNFLAMVSVKL
jgi:iron complex outermembrane recepter protein